MLTCNSGLQNTHILQSLVWHPVWSAYAPGTVTMTMNMTKRSVTVLVCFLVHHMYSYLSVTAHPLTHCLELQAFDSSALGGGVGGGGMMGRDADQENTKTDGPASGASSDPAVS